MNPSVKGKLRSFETSSPLGEAPQQDPWSQFRTIELIDMRLDFRFNHSLGKLSRFFLELESHRLMGTKCPTCEKVWLPPRVLCPDDWTITTWVELEGRGVLEAASRSAYTATTDGGTDELVLGYVKVEGAHTSLLQRIRNYGDPQRLVNGLPLRVVWATEDVNHPMELFWFEPVS